MLLKMYIKYYNIKKIIFSLFTITFLYSCGIKRDVSVLRYFPPTQEEVMILGAGQTIPVNAILIGNITIGDTGFTLAKNCTYEKILKEASTIAKQMGGNVLYVVSHKEPDFESTCHRINVNIYHVKK